MAAGLEDTLIYEINPEWNYSGKNKMKEDEESQKINQVKRQIQKAKREISFDVRLARTYFNQGFINVPVSRANLLAGDGLTIEITLGGQEDVIHGYINRRANKNESPRIMGGVALKDWFHRTFKPDDVLKVTIVSPISIRLTKDL